jgi:hypothetical protein
VIPSQSVSRYQLSVIEGIQISHRYSYNNHNVFFSCFFKLQCNNWKNLSPSTPQRKDVGKSPARTRCTDRSAGKVVRRKDCNFKFKNSTVANWGILFEPSLITRGLTEGPSQLFSATGPKLYTPEQDLEDCASQLGATTQIGPRNIMDLGSDQSHNWLKSPGMRCKGPIGNQETGALARDAIRKQLPNGLESI